MNDMPFGITHPHCTDHNITCPVPECQACACDHCHECGNCAHEMCDHDAI
ncbi:hypothetical protein [Streptomyces hydrogenans]